MGKIMPDMRKEMALNRLVGYIYLIITEGDGFCVRQGGHRI